MVLAKTNAPAYTRPRPCMGSDRDVTTNLTRLLDAVERGEDDAVNLLFEAVYDDLRGLARAQRRRRVQSPTMSTTVLVHEAYLKLAKQTQLSWKNRVHFFATAAKVIRHVIANYAERKAAAKRGGGQSPLPLDEMLFVSDESAEEALAIHLAIGRLEAERPRMAQVLECRIFGGMTVEETAEALSMSTATIKRDWSAGTAWLFTELDLKVQK